METVVHNAPAADVMIEIVVAVKMRHVAVVVVVVAAAAAAVENPPEKDGAGEEYVTFAAMMVGCSEVYVKEVAWEASLVL